MIRKENIKYEFSVEGETEKWYLQWLESMINDTEESTYKVSFCAKVTKNPRKFIKNINSISTEKLYHVCDVEGSDLASLNSFNSVLDNLHEASESKGIEYFLGYCNMSFELWLILHKQNYNGNHTNKTEYLAAINKSFSESFSSLSDFKKEANFKRCLGKLRLADVRDAIARANSIMRENESCGRMLVKYKDYEYYKDNPSLSIHSIIEEVMGLCGLVN